MKRLTIVASLLLLLTACKEEKKETILSPVVEKSANITIKDTVNTVGTVEETITTTSKQDQIIVKSPDNKPLKVEYASFGSKIAADKAITAADMMKKYASMKKGDTISIKFKSKIKDVCKKKGCWMSMELPGGKESFVRFKDYAFFVPMNADNSDAIVSGRAFLDVISVDELKHYAKDGGKPQEEIDKITSPKITYAFQADGVLIQE